MCTCNSDICRQDTLIKFINLYECYCRQKNRATRGSREEEARSAVKEHYCNPRTLAA